MSSWVDKEAGPIVRPYAMTSGRTQPVQGAFDLFSMVVALASLSIQDTQPESAAIMRMCQKPVSVAELAAHLDLPAGTVKVLLGDLLARQLIVTRAPDFSSSDLEAVIHGLQSL
ncbi:DUF742 domain-containing protein [Catelliglobosispora koreensis]|uniref:DUF742 domain-containing protein n=1 Tax=Catelliglobosispora koreensis TaxID=129052 RepID=UPI00038235C2|nr:DUF742 domain-containing protein [Catelliglobosispora koreensis]